MNTSIDSIFIEKPENREVKGLIIAFVGLVLFLFVLGIALYCESHHIDFVFNRTRESIFAGCAFISLAIASYGIFEMAKNNKEDNSKFSRILFFVIPRTLVVFGILILLGYIKI